MIKNVNSSFMYCTSYSSQTLIKLNLGKLKSYQISNFMKISPDGQTDGQRDMAKLIVSFHNFSNAPKNCFVR
jgi:hypothetical protein